MFNRLLILEGDIIIYNYNKSNLQNNKSYNPDLLETL